MKRICISMMILELFLISINIYEQRYQFILENIALFFWAFIAWMWVTISEEKQKKIDLYKELMRMDNQLIDDYRSYKVSAHDLIEQYRVNKKHNEELIEIQKRRIEGLSETVEVQRRLLNQ
jgi:hypothetical protein